VNVGTKSSAPGRDGIVEMECGLWMIILIGLRQFPALSFPRVVAALGNPGVWCRLSKGSAQVLPLRIHSTRSAKFAPAHHAPNPASR
jgi:hypothetical protein